MVLNNDITKFLPSRGLHKVPKLIEDQTDRTGAWAGSTEAEVSQTKARVKRWRTRQVCERGIMISGAAV